MMGHPFSVAGSAVGVVSLGLQVCQGPASYIDKYKSADKEVNNIKCKVEGLNLILQELSDLLKVLVGPIRRCRASSKSLSV